MSRPPVEPARERRDADRGAGHDRGRDSGGGSGGRSRQEGELARRYGRRAPGDRPWWRRPLPLLGAVVAAVLVLGYGVWVAVEQTAGPTATEIGHRILDDTTAELRLEINHQPGVAARCTVAALSSTSAEVGLLDVDVAADEPAAVQRTVTVRTTSRAVTVRVGSCSEVPNP